MPQSTSARARMMKQVFLLGLLIISFALCIPALAADDCADSDQRETAQHLAEGTRDAEIRGVIDNFLTWPLIASLPPDTRKQFGERFTQEAHDLWNAPDHFQKIVAFYCTNIASGTLNNAPGSVESVLARRKDEAQEERTIWTMATLKKLEGEFPELSRPDSLLVLGDLYGRNRQWVFAKDNFKKVLQAQPSNPAAIEWTGAIPFYEHGLLDSEAANESLSAFRKLVQVEPKGPEGHYWIGVIDWGIAFNYLQRLRMTYNKTVSTPLSDEDILPISIRESFSAKDGGIVDDGIQHLQAAIKLAPQFAEAQFYLSYLYRVKGAESATPSERKRYTRMADDLIAEARRLAPSAERGLRPDIPPPPPPPPAKGIRIGGNVAAAKLIRQVPPEYPPLARQAKISGTVRLRVIISTDGTIEQVELVSGHPLLVQSAMDAVRQWRFQQTLLNGQPVQVETVVDVLFEQ